MCSQEARGLLRLAAADEDVPVADAEGAMLSEHGAENSLRAIEKGSSASRPFASQRGNVLFFPNEVVPYRARLRYTAVSNSTKPG